MNPSQPFLFDFTQVSSGAVELFPAVWGALEDLAAPEAAQRQSGLNKLVELGAPRLSPLVAYMLSTRLVDKDLPFRCKVASVLGGVLVPDRQGNPPPEQVRIYLQASLSQMSQGQVLALLEVAEADPALQPAVGRLFNACPTAGGMLAAVAGDRQSSLSLRKQAVVFIGLVGFLDALPALERLQNRLEARLSGQQSMPFAPPPSSDEADLLPVIQKTVATLG